MSQWAYFRTHGRRRKGGREAGSVAGLAFRTGLALALAMPGAALGQDAASSRLAGRVLLGDSVLRAGTVVLHHVSAADQVGMDSIGLNPDGTFEARVAGDDGGVVFASVRYAGTLYLGPTVSLPVPAEPYEMHVFDTIGAGVGGNDLVILARTVVLEGDGAAWRVTDMFQMVNAGDYTLVPGVGGAVWSHSVPPGVMEASLEANQFGSAVGDVTAGRVRITTGVPPGEQVVVARYTAADPMLTLPVDEATPALDVLVREPAPPLDIPGFASAETVSTPDGGTYRRYTAASLVPTTIRIGQGRPPELPPVRTFALLMTLALAAAGAWTVAQAGETRGAGAPHHMGRTALLRQVALLDETFAAVALPSPEEIGAYEARRRKLIRALQRRAGP